MTMLQFRMCGSRVLPTCTSTVDQPSTSPVSSLTGGFHLNFHKFYQFHQLYNLINLTKFDKINEINLNMLSFSPEPPAYIFWYHNDEVGLKRKWNLWSFSSTRLCRTSLLVVGSPWSPRMGGKHKAILSSGFYPFILSLWYGNWANFHL